MRHHSEETATSSELGQYCLKLLPSKHWNYCPQSLAAQGGSIQAPSSLNQSSWLSRYCVPLKSAPWWVKKFKDKPHCHMIQQVSAYLQENTVFARLLFLECVCSFLRTLFFPPICGSLRDFFRHSHRTAKGPCSLSRRLPGGPRRRGGRLFVRKWFSRCWGGHSKSSLAISVMALRRCRLLCCNGDRWLAVHTGAHPDSRGEGVKKPPLALQRAHTNTCIKRHSTGGLCDCG